MLHWHDYLEILTALIVIVDPLGAIPIFLGLTSDQTLQERKKTARTASIAAYILLVIAAIVGGRFDADLIKPLLDGARGFIGGQDAAPGGDHGLGDLVELGKIHSVLHLGGPAAQRGGDF